MINVAQYYTGDVLGDLIEGLAVQLSEPVPHMGALGVYPG